MIVSNKSKTKLDLFLQKQMSLRSHLEVKIKELLSSYREICKETDFYSVLLADSENFWRIYELLVCYIKDVYDWHDLPIKIRIQLGIDRCDRGVDAISQDLKTAIQIKYKPRSKITFTELSTFITYGEKILKCEHLNLVTHENPEFGKMWTKLRDSIHHECLSNELIKQFLHEIWAKENLIPPPLPTLLRYYQREALNVVLNNPDPEVRIEMACGTGKTFVMMELSREGRNVIFVPNLVLLEQVSDVLNKFGIQNEKIGTNYEKVDLAKQNFVCVYNSGYKLSEITFRRVIVDEGHHFSVPEIYREIIDDNESEASSADAPVKFGAVISQIKCDQRVLFSATLDNADYSYDLRKAIEEGFLVDYDINIPVLIDSISGLAQLLLENPHFSHVLAYANRLEEAREFRDECLKRHISCGYLDGTMRKEEREFVLEQFKCGKLRVISSVGTIGEGIDLIIANTCLFITRKNSRIAIIQHLGRILRKCTGKLMGHVILPSGEDMKVFMDAISEKDTEVRKERMERRRGRTLCVSLNLEEGMEERDDEIDEKIMMDVYDSRGGIRRQEAWMFMRELLKRFTEEKGRLPKDKEEFEGRKLGNWCGIQRGAKKGRGNCIMTQGRIDLLESIPGWKWEIGGDDEWMKILGTLDRFAKINGRLPRWNEEFEGIKLGFWVSNQRQGRKGVRFITPERERLLKSILHWTWETDKDSEWKENFESLGRFVGINGKLPKRDEEFEGRKLGEWIHNQRQIRKGRGGSTMSDERIQLLESLPFWRW